MWLNVLTDWRARANSAIFSLDERVTELERRPSGGGSGPVAVSITAESTTIHIQGTVSVVAFLDSADGAVQVNLQDGRADGQEVGESEPCSTTSPSRTPGCR